MAMAKGNVLLDEIYDQFLICKICYELYKRPKTLSCLHTFCEICLIKHQDAELERSYRYMLYSRAITCPICRKKTELPSGGVRRLPDNFLVDNLTDVCSKRLPSNKAPMCEICLPEDPGPHFQATTRCLDCSKLMCKSCVELHKKTKVTENHSLFDTEVEKDIECKVHKGETVRFYCEPCESCICVVCTFHDHKGHEVTSFSDGMKKYQSSLDGLVTMCKERIDHVKDKLELINRCENEIKNAEGSIRDMAIDTISTIRKQERDMVTDLHTTFGDDTMQFLKEKNVLQEDLQNLQSTCNLTDIIVRDKSAELLLLKRDIQDKFSSVLDKSLTDTPSKIKRRVTFVPGSCNIGYLHVENDISGDERDSVISPTDKQSPRFGQIDYASQTEAVKMTESWTDMGKYIMDIYSEQMTQTDGVKTIERSSSPIMPYTPAIKIRSRGTMTNADLLDKKSILKRKVSPSPVDENDKSVTQKGNKRVSFEDSDFRDVRNRLRDTSNDTGTCPKKTFTDETSTVTNNIYTLSQATMVDKVTTADKVTSTVRIRGVTRESMTDKVTTFDMASLAHIIGDDKGTCTASVVTMTTGVGVGDVRTNTQGCNTLQLKSKDMGVNCKEDMSNVGSLTTTIKGVDAAMYSERADNGNGIQHELDNTLRASKDCISQTAMSLPFNIIVHNLAMESLISSQSGSEFEIVLKKPKLDFGCNTLANMPDESECSRCKLFNIESSAKSQDKQNSISATTMCDSGSDPCFMECVPSTTLCTDSATQYFAVYKDVSCNTVDIAMPDSSAKETDHKPIFVDAETSTFHSVHVQDATNETEPQPTADVSTSTEYKTTTDASAMTHIPTSDVGTLKRPHTVSRGMVTHNNATSTTGTTTDQTETSDSISFVSPGDFQLPSVCIGTDVVNTLDISTNTRTIDRRSLALSPIRLGFTDRMCSPVRETLVTRACSPIRCLTKDSNTNTDSPVSVDMGTNPHVTAHVSRPTSPIRQMSSDISTNTPALKLVDRGINSITVPTNDEGVMAIAATESVACGTKHIALSTVSTETTKVRHHNSCTEMPQIHTMDRETTMPQIHTMHKNVATDSSKMADKQTNTVNVTQAYRDHISHKPWASVDRETNTPNTHLTTKQTSPIRELFTDRASSPVKVVTFDKGISVKDGEIKEPVDKYQAAGITQTKPSKPIADGPKRTLSAIMEDSIEENSSSEEDISSFTQGFGRRHKPMTRVVSDSFLNRRMNCRNYKDPFEPTRFNQKSALSSSTFNGRNSPTSIIWKVEMATNTGPPETSDKCVSTDSLPLGGKMAECISKLKTVRERLEQSPASQYKMTRSDNEGKQSPVLDLHRRKSCCGRLDNEDYSPFVSPVIPRRPLLPLGAMTCPGSDSSQSESTHSESDQEPQAPSKSRHSLARKQRPDIKQLLSSAQKENGHRKSARFTTVVPKTLPKFDLDGMEIRDKGLRTVTKVNEAVSGKCRPASPRKPTTPPTATATVSYVRPKSPRVKPGDPTKGSSVQQAQSKLTYSPNGSPKPISPPRPRNTVHRLHDVADSIPFSRRDQAKTTKPQPEIKRAPTHRQEVAPTMGTITRVLSPSQTKNFRARRKPRHSALMASIGISEVQEDCASLGTSPSSLGTSPSISDKESSPSVSKDSSPSMSA